MVVGAAREACGSAPSWLRLPMIGSSLRRGKRGGSGKLAVAAPAPADDDLLDGGGSSTRLKRWTVARTRRSRARRS